MEAAEKKYPDGSVYTGKLKDGKPHGKGKLVWPNGLYFEGSFKNGLYDGPGSLFYPSGAKEVANYRRGVKHGKMDLYNSAGELVQKRTFVFGILQTDRRYQVDGEHVDIKLPKTKRGSADLSLEDAELPSGDRYKGQYKQGLYHGEGTIITPDGTEREATFKKGQVVGEMFHYPAYKVVMGLVIKDTFENGLLVKKEFFRGEKKYREMNFQGGVPHGESYTTLPGGVQYVTVYNNGLVVTRDGEAKKE